MPEYGFIASDGTANVDEVAQKLLHYDSRKTSFLIYHEDVVNMGTPVLTFDDGDFQEYTCSQSVPHGLNFTPTYLAFCKTLSGFTIRCGAGHNQESFIATTDGLNLNLSYKYTRDIAFDPAPTLIPLSAYYFIYADAADASAVLTPIVDAPKFGIRIAKDGYDVDYPYIQGYQFLYPPMKIKAQSAQDISSNSSTIGHAIIPHGLPFRPAFRTRIQYSDGTIYPTPYTVIDGPSTWDYVDDTSLHVFFYAGSSASGIVTVRLHYTIYAERAQ